MQTLRGEEMVVGMTFVYKFLKGYDFVGYDFRIVFCLSESKLANEILPPKIRRTISGV